MDLLCQFQADVLGVPVRRPAVRETTALGAALPGRDRRAGSGTPRRTPRRHGNEEAAFSPGDAGDEVDRRYAEWRRGVERARGLGARRRRVSGQATRIAGSPARRGTSATSTGRSSACFVAYVSRYS